MPSASTLRRLCLLPAALLAGCGTVVLNPSGDVAVQQAQLVVISTLLMLLIVVPVIGLTLLFAWRYRESAGATYKPDWDHSIQLELVIWSAPLIIIIALGAITWISTHTLDPFRTLRRIDTNRVVAPGVKPINVDVVALDWKWLFIYPDHGIAVVNEFAAPVDVPIHFRVTAESVMNAFYVPALAGMIYAMPGMQSKLHAVINQPGDYQGLSANYSGEGFTDMRFTFRGLSGDAFQQWVQSAKAGGAQLTRESYIQLAKPSQRNAVQRYSGVAADLFGAIVGRCVEPGKMCLRHMAALDSRRGARPAAGSAAICTADDPRGTTAFDFRRSAAEPPRRSSAEPPRRTPAELSLVARD